MRAIWMAVLALPAWGQIAEQPVLRIEAGMHTAAIRAIAADAAGRFLVTGSEDKTVRVWDLASGRLLQILRPPIGNGDDGKIYAVAISPDGATVACSGFTGDSGKINIYFFDRASGRMVRRIGALPEVVMRLAYSPDGRLLAAGVGSKNGIRIYRTHDYSLADEDQSYTGRVQGLQFGPSGSGLLAATSYDGIVRLYRVAANGQLTAIAKRASTTSQQPFGVAFSPDASKIAVGYGDVAAVDVFSAKDLSPLFTAQPDKPNHSLIRPAWSPDGSVLYAGGGYNRDGCLIVRWADGGRGPATELHASENTITDILPLTSGGVAFSALDPAWGVIGRDGQKVVFTGPSLRDFRFDQRIFGVSRDGFNVEWKDVAPEAFSIAERQYKPAGSASIKTPDIGGLPVTDWEDRTDPKLNGNPIPLRPYETSRSLAVAPDKRSFLLGTDWNLRRFDAAGKELWSVPTPDVAWDVNISGDGTLALAAYGDGAIHWYRMQDGQELLALFPHPDGKRWVLWTPGGHYDASAGAEDLIGWHVNHGLDAAGDFFPASKFRSIYYRPDVISRVLATHDEKQAVELADAEAGRKLQPNEVARMAPPVVRILSPQDGAAVSNRKVAVRYEATSAEPVTGVRVLVDGRPVDVSKGAAPADGNSLRVSVPARDCAVSVIAENRFAASEPATVRIHWSGASETAVVEPKLYILAVGVSAYPKPYELLFAAKDARDFAASVKQQKGRLYRDVEVRLLVDGQAVRADVIDGLEWLRKSAGQRDVAMLLFSGRGVNDAGGTYFFLPPKFDAEHLPQTAVAESEIRLAVQAIAGKVVIFFDTSRAGNLPGGRAPDVNRVVNDLASTENGAVVFASSSGTQSALEKPEWGNGAFVKALIEGLSGAADSQHTGRITVDMLDGYVSQRVKELTGGQQTPAAAKPSTIADFPLAMR